ncbi:MAG: hypothetical protein R2792_04560 [Saprospiraceae bacterium]
MHHVPFPKKTTLHFAMLTLLFVWTSISSVWAQQSKWIESYYPQINKAELLLIDSQYAKAEKAYS